jgi:hypothetical protein
MKAERCVFCASGAAETRDHVPPRSFFPVKLPASTRLITVPCCNACHKGSQATDAVLRNLFVSIRETESSKYVRHGLVGKRDGSFDRNRAEFLRLLRLVQRVEVKTPAGIYLGEDFAFNFDVPIVHKFSERACRAVLWEEFRLSYFVGTFDWRKNVDLGDLVYAGLAKFGRVRKVHDVFAYGVTAPKDSASGWVVLNFYGSLEIFARVGLVETKQANDQSTGEQI